MYITRKIQNGLKKVLKVNFIVGLIFNLIFYCFPKELVGIFISKTDSNYQLFMEFAVLTCHSFLLLMGLNFLEMTTSIVVQSLGNVKKATAVSFIRQIILFIPIACFMGITLNKGLIGILQSGPIADAITFIVAIIIITSEYKKLSSSTLEEENTDKENTNRKQSSKEKRIVITISREYGSGGRYVGKLLAESLNIPFYDKELITLTSKSTGLGKKYIQQTEQKLSAAKFEGNNDDRIFLAEEKVIKKLAKNSCVIVGRCADYILKDNQDVISIFLYSDEENKIKRAVKYYNLEEKTAKKQIKKINQARAKHYKYYTNRNWYDFSNYNLILNVDSLGVEKNAKLIEDYIKAKNSK